MTLKESVLRNTDQYSVVTNGKRKEKGEVKEKYHYTITRLSQKKRGILKHGKRQRPLELRRAVHEGKKQ